MRGLQRKGLTLMPQVKKYICCGALMLSWWMVQSGLIGAIHTYQCHLQSYAGCHHDKDGPVLHHYHDGSHCVICLDLVYGNPKMVVAPSPTAMEFVGGEKLVAAVDSFHLTLSRYWFFVRGPPVFISC